VPMKQEGRRLPGAQPGYQTPPPSEVACILPRHRDDVVDLVAYRTHRAELAEAGYWWGGQELHTWTVAEASRWPA
jgi:hypothetical protein